MKTLLLDPLPISRVIGKGPGAAREKYGPLETVTLIGCPL